MSDNEIIFTYINNIESRIKVYHDNDKDYIEYIPYDGEGYKHKWIMKNSYINYDTISLCKTNKIMMLSIEINTDEELNSGDINNYLDDIAITYVFDNDLSNLNKCND
jgi:hypothetical protein